MKARFVGTAALAAFALTLAGVAHGAQPAGPPLLSFPGLDSSQLPGANPADVQIAEGPGGVVEMVNSSAALWDLSTGTPQSRGTLTLGELFSGGGVDRSKDDTTDPRVLYDPVAGRFWGAMFDITRRETDFGVTAGGDPAGSRYAFGLSSPGCPDQPRLGVSNTVVVLTDDLFTSCQSSGSFVGGEVIVASKQDMLAGTNPRSSRFGPSAAFSAITPAVSLTPSATAYLVSVAANGKSLGVVRVNGPNVSSLPVATVPLARTLKAPPPAPQPGTRTAVDTGDIRVQDAYIEDGTLWLTAAEACPSSAQRACARIVAVDTATSRVLVDRALTLASGRSLLYPAIAPDGRGNVVIAFEYSSATDYPSLAYTYMRPDGDFGAPADVLRGTAANTSGRFGDYSGAARDPEDPARVWVAGEIGSAVGGSMLGWSTGIGSVTVPAQPPAVIARGTKAAGTAVTVSAVVYPEGGVTAYRVRYGTTKAAARRTAARPVPATTLERHVSIRVGGLRRGAKYYFQVVATSAQGTGRTPQVRVSVPAPKRKR